MSERIFISYTKADRAKANKICEGLEARGLECWIAPRDIPPGVTDWAEPIVEALHSASALVLVLSNATRFSDDVANEIRIAKEDKLRIIPIEIEQVKELSGRLRFRMGGAQRIEVFEGQFDDHINRLADKLKNRSPGDEEPPRPPWWRRLWATVDQRPAIVGGIAIFAASAFLFAVLRGPGIIEEILGPPSRDSGVGIEGKSPVSREGIVRIAGKQFIESSILVELMALMIERKAGNQIDVQRTHWVQANEVLIRDLRLGAIDLVPDYSGNVLFQYLQVDPEKYLEENPEVTKSRLFRDNSVVREILEDPKFANDHDALEWLDSFGFKNNYQFVMLRDNAEDLGLLSGAARPHAARAPTISDLARIAERKKHANRVLSMGIEPTFKETQRVDGFAALIKKYPRLRNLSVELTTHENKFRRLNEGKIDVALAYTTDPELNKVKYPRNAYGQPLYVELKDDREFFADYYAAPLARRAALETYPKVRKAMEELAGKISEHDMRTWIGTVEVNGIDGELLNIDDGLQDRFRELCRNFLASKGLIEPGPDSSEPPVPRWNLKKQLFVGQAIPLSWTYQESSIDPLINHSIRETPICLEIQSAAKPSFDTGDRFADVRKEETCWSPGRVFLAETNGTRFWRAGARTSPTDTTLPRWSSIKKLTQFNSIYTRIQTTKKLRIYTSNNPHQGSFNWLDGGVRYGVDIELARLIQRKLASRMQRDLELRLIPKDWSVLLSSVKEGLSDLVIATLSKTRKRERVRSMAFSQPYFCTGYALIHFGRRNAPNSGLRNIIAGKIVGVQNETTNHSLAILLREAGIEFELKGDFPGTKNLINALKRKKIDYAIVDAAFARSAQLEVRDPGRPPLEYRDLWQEDMPGSMKDKYKQEYAVAVERQEEDLLRIINQAITEAKNNGTLASIYKEAAEQYEAKHNPMPRSRRLSDTPWECGTNDHNEEKLIAE